MKPYIDANELRDAAIVGWELGLYVRLRLRTTAHVVYEVLFKNSHKIDFNLDLEHSRRMRVSNITEDSLYPGARFTIQVGKAGNIVIEADEAKTIWLEA